MCKFLDVSVPFVGIFVAIVLKLKCLQARSAAGAVAAADPHALQAMMTSVTPVVSEDTLPETAEMVVVPVVGAMEVEVEVMDDEVIAGDPGTEIMIF